MVPAARGGAPGAAGLDQVPETDTGPVPVLLMLMLAASPRDPGQPDPQPGDQVEGFHILGGWGCLSSVPGSAGRIQVAVYVLACPCEGQGEAARGAAVRDRLAAGAEQGHAQAAVPVPGRRREEVAEGVGVGGAPAAG